MKSKGNILKERIKQRGFTQADFADTCGISLSALKKYITDELPYSIALLEIFAEKLDCSTAYLLGESNTTMSELHDLKTQTHLSDAALLYLKGIAHDYDKAVKNRVDRGSVGHREEELITISYLLEDNELIYLIERLLYFDEDSVFFEIDEQNKVEIIKIGGIRLDPDDTLGTLKMSILNRLDRMREEFSKIKDKSAILTEEVSEYAKKCTRKWLNS